MSDRDKEQGILVMTLLDDCFKVLEDEILTQIDVLGALEAVKVVIVKTMDPPGDSN